MIKKFVFSAFCLLFVIFCVSCPKENLPAVAEEEEVSLPVPVETFVTGKILSKRADLCLFGRDSKMHSVIKLSAGDDISILEIDGIIDEKFVPDVDSSVLAQNSDSSAQENAKTAEEESEESSETVEIPGTKYVHIVHDMMDFWLEKSIFALNCENAVAIEKTTLFSDQDLTQKLDSPQNPLKFAALIAKSTEKNENLAENSNSVKIFFYDTAKKSVAEAFVSSSSVSTLKDDIIVSQIAEELKVTKRAAPRNELFKKAAKYKPSKKVLAALNSQKVETKSYNYQEVLKSMQRMTFGVNVDELMTVDQSKDPFK